MLLVIGCPPNAIAYSFRQFKASDITKVGLGGDAGFDLDPGSRGGGVVEHFGTCLIALRMRHNSQAVRSSFKKERSHGFRTIR